MNFQIKSPTSFLQMVIIPLLLATYGCNEKPLTDPHAGHDHGDETSSHEESPEGAQDFESDGIHISPISLIEAGIVVEELQLGQLSSTFDLPGTVMPHPDGEGFVGSLVNGRIKEILVDLGDSVIKGDALCIIESPAIGDAEAALISALAELEFLKGDLERHKILATEGIGSQKDQLVIQSQYSAVAGNVSAAKITLRAYGFSAEDVINLESNQHTGGKVTLRSPVSGNVNFRDARIGKQVTPDSDLFHIVNLERLRVKVDIPEKNITDISEGLQVVVLTQNGHLSAFMGVIDRFGASVNPQTRMLTAYASVENKSRELFPGAFTTVRLTVGRFDEQVLAIPVDALLRDEHGHTSVFVEQIAGVFVNKEIETGITVDGKIIISSGISAGERVVTRGVFAIKSEADKSHFGHGHAH
jgi:membrane fusion protein, heavy metal efflux system